MELDNALVRQKDAILVLVNNEQWEEAIALLNFTANLWRVCGYDYKTREIRARIADALADKRDVCAHWKQHQKWEKMRGSLSC